MKKVRITQLPTFEIEVDGKKLPGTFKVESEWNGFVKLSCSGPCADVIVYSPRATVGNIHDLVPKMFGGNRDANVPLVVESDEVRSR